MDLSKAELCGGVGILVGSVSAVLGGFDILLKCLLLLMAIDIITGFLASAVYGHSRYTSHGKVSSSAMVQGSVRKILILCVVAIGVVVDRVINMDYARNACVMYFICSEAISVFENLDHCEVPIPKFIRTILETIKEQEDNAKPED